MSRETRGPEVAIDFKEANLKKSVEKPPLNPVGSLLEQFFNLKEFAKIERSKADFSYLTPEERAESMWALFQDIRRFKMQLPLTETQKPGIKKKPRPGVEEEPITRLVRTGERKLSPKDLAELQLKFSILWALYDDEEASKVFERESQRYLKDLASINGDFEKYKALSEESKKARQAYDASVKDIFLKRGEKVGEAEKLVLELNARRLIELEEKLKQLMDENGELAALAENEDLKRYSAQLRRGNYIWTPSRRGLLERMEKAALTGRPVLLSGESGTGKSELAKQASLILTGKICNETPGKDTRFQDLVAKPKILLDGTTVFEYKEIGEAVTGRETSAEGQPLHDGRLVLDDEFNTLPTDEQTNRLARIAGWTPGKKIKMPVTNQEIRVGSGFLYCAAVNLASERYERKKIPPEVLRKFSKIDVGYPPQTAEEPELFEMMLAALLDDNDRLRAAKGELSPLYDERERESLVNKDGQEVRQTVRIRELKETVTGTGGRVEPAGGFLWRLANALGELNKSFSHQETVLKSRGEAQFIRELVIDTGKILSWLKTYTTLERTESLEKYLAGKIQEEFLATEAYSAEDRNLVKDFLKHFGIDVDKIIKDKDKKRPAFEILTPLQVGLLSPRVQYKKVVKEEPVLTSSYYLTSEGERVDYQITPYDFDGKKIMPHEKLVAPDGTAYEYLGVTEGGDPVLVPYQEKSKPGGKTRETIDLTREQREVFDEFFGANNLERVGMPSAEELTDDFFDRHYLAVQTDENTQKGLVAQRPDWWNKAAKAEIVGNNPETWGEAFIRSIKKETQQLAGNVFWVESIQKPNYISGSQLYGTVKGTESGHDHLLPIFQEVLGVKKTRFNLTFDECLKVAEKIKEKITQKLQKKKMPIPNFDVVICPALLFNLLIEINPANSATNTGEWASTPLLHQNDSDTGRRLLVGYSGSGGASCLGSAPSWRSVGQQRRPFRGHAKKQLKTDC